MSTRLTTEEFIRRAKERHGNSYDYSRVVYRGRHRKVEIVCPKHGPFWQTPHNHWRSRGCPLCASRPPRLSTAEFIAKAKTIHPDKYDYSLVEYVNMRTKVEIICPTHGPFWQLPRNHLQGTGCPQCVRKSTTGEDD